MTESEIIEQGHQEGRAFINSMLSTDPPEVQLSWLKNAYCTMQGTINALRYRNKELREMVLAWDEVRPKRLTVREAQMLHCCRICKGQYSSNWLLNYGAEFAHRACVEREKAVPNI